MINAHTDLNHLTDTELYDYPIFNSPRSGLITTSPKAIKGIEHAEHWNWTTFPINLLKCRCVKGLNNGICCSNISRTYPVHVP